LSSGGKTLKGQVEIAAARTRLKRRPVHVQSYAHSQSLFTRDGAGLPQYAAKDCTDRAVSSPKIQLANFLAGQDQSRAKFSIGTFKVGHQFDPLAYQQPTTARVTHIWQ
jgi:hypothetical protein